MLRATGPDDTARTTRATRATWTHGRRGAVTAASAAVVVLGGVLAACAGHGPGGGYVAIGAAGGPERGSTTRAAPTGSVSLVPLDSGKNGAKDGGKARGTNGRDTPSGSRGPSNSPVDAPGSGQPSGSPGDTGSAQQVTPSADPPGTSAGTPGPAAPTPPTPGSPTPTTGPGRTATPAALSWGKPTTKAVDQRWCQKVTVGFHNSGGTAVRSGSVTFGTHIIGALGIDWGTVDSAADLPVPIAPGAHKSPTWTVCVDAWRVPLGMHIETRDVSVQWK
ncbi:hypothetical protein [Streptomyces yokosukanensis]|uniref:hypothetical protein n=1 Tax=Streptomyces yokosukanensis TaxID=67386 RepID=UPI00099E2F41|nr:hypothetical protein [Streptomyces yokosukanensis]